MEAHKINQHLKTYSLTFDEPLLSSIRNGLDISYKAGDQIIVDLTQDPTPGSLVLVQIESNFRLCRYECIHGNQYLFPPLEIDPSQYPEAIVGEVVEHVRIKKWLTTEK